jgi:ferric-dicitrate binding protein FerR (iron transport regulator)
MDKKLHNNNDLVFKEMKTDEKIIWLSGQYEVPQTMSKEEAFQKLKLKIAEKKEPAKVIKLTKWHYLISAAAALVLLIIGFTYFWSGSSNENLVAAKGQHSDYKLPDGSTVSMNADSKLSYDKRKFGKKRLVEFDGEAFFNIEKGNPFIINTNLAEIKILGTSFNVYARESQFSVSCFTGKIKVSSGSQSVIIIPGQTAYLEKNMLKVRMEQNINATAKWRVGEFYYENESLSLIFNEIERQFNVTFVLPKIDDRKFTGSFTNKNLVDALETIKVTMGLDYEIGSNGKILIKDKSD